MNIDINKVEAKKMFALLKELDTIADNEEGLLEKKIKIVKVVTGMSDDEIKAMKVADFLSLYNSIDVDGQIRRSGMPYKREVDGVKIKFVQLMSELSTGAYIDLQMYLARGNVYDNAVNICSCFALIWDDEKGKYQYKSTDGIKYIERLPFSDLYNIFLFFCELKPKLDKILEHYLKEQKEKVKKSLLSA